MNKQTAHRRALNHPPTVGELRALIASKAGDLGQSQSRVNPDFLLKDTLAIYALALAHRPGDEQLVMEYCDPVTCRMRKTGDYLLTVNVLRDTA